LPVLECLERRALLASITEYPIPGGTTTLGNGLFGITGGPDGNVYFTDTQDNAIGQIDPSGNIHEFPNAPGKGGGFFKNGLDGITLGSSNNLVFAESTQGALGEMTTEGSYNSIPIDSTGDDTGQEPDQITTSKDGTIWFTENGANAIGELTPAGVFSQYPVQGAINEGIIGPSLKGITVGSDGNVWFTNWSTVGDFIGELTTSTGNVTEYTLPGDTSPVGIVGGPDGNLWFVAYGTNTIDVMSTSGTILRQYPVTVPAGEGGLGSLEYITVGSDKNLYFTAQDGYIGEITTSGAVTSTPVSTTVTTVPGSSGPQPLAVTSAPDGNIWFTDPWTDSVGVLRIGASSSGALPTMAALTASTASAVSGQSVRFTATVSDLYPGGATPNGGTVTFSDQKGALASASLVNGVATYTTSSLPAGADEVSASYSGTASFAASSTGTIATVAGNGTAGDSGSNGPATDAELDFPGGLAVDSAGDLLITDGNNYVVHEVVKATGDIVTFAGNGHAGYSGDGGPATDAELNLTNSVAIDSAGDLFMSDAGNHRIREVVKATGDIKTVAGTGTAGYSGDGGPATGAEVQGCCGLAVDSAANLFIADSNNNVVREVSAATGDITTVAGNGKAGYRGDIGSAIDAELNNPVNVAVDSAGDLFIADQGNNVVREVVEATGKIITIAGTGAAGYSGDGGHPTDAELQGCVGLAFDSEGDLFIGDSVDNVVREVVRATGDITTVAGDGRAGYRGDGGPATAAEFSRLSWLAVGSAGELFVCDAGNSVVREVTPAVTVTVAVGRATLVIHTQPSGNAVAGAAFADQPVIYLEDQNGNLVTNDNSTVVTVSLASGTGTLQGTKSVTVEGGVATFANLSETKAGIISLEFSAAGVTAGPSTSITVSPAAAYQLLIQTRPSTTATAGQPFAIQPIVSEVDQYGNVETGDNSTPITVSLSSGNGPLIGTTTVTMSAGVATFAGLGNSRAGIISLDFSGAGFTVGPSNNIFVFPPIAAPPPPTVMAETVVTSQKTNNRGRPLGKKTLSGFTIRYSVAMDPMSAENHANYTVAATTIKRKKNKPRESLTPVNFNATYDPSNDLVTLTIIGKNPFAMGGQITIVGSPPNGVRSQAGAFLGSSDIVLSVGKNAKGITLASFAGS
jgi:streptogramin lyase